jgi:hypothetical protein
MDAAPASPTVNLLSLLSTLHCRVKIAHLGGTDQHGAIPENTEVYCPAAVLKKSANRMQGQDSMARRPVTKPR